MSLDRVSWLGDWWDVGVNLRCRCRLAETLDEGNALCNVIPVRVNPGEDIGHPLFHLFKSTWSDRLDIGDALDTIKEEVIQLPCLCDIIVTSLETGHLEGHLGSGVYHFQVEFIEHDYEPQQVSHPQGFGAEYL